MNIYKKSFRTFRQKKHQLDMRYCLMNSFFLYWNQERRFPMNKKYLLQIIIIASLVFGGFTLFILLFLTKHQILFFTENNISDHLFRYFLDFLIYGLLLDPLAGLYFLSLLFNFTKRIIALHKQLFMQSFEKKQWKIYYSIGALISFA